MSSSLCLCPDTVIRRLAASLGAVATGFARAERISDGAAAQFADWLGRGHAAGMHWLEHHEPLRRHPANVMPGVKTVIVTAWPYAPAGGYHHPCIADYALGRDYHRVVRGRLELIGRRIFDLTGAFCRPAVDSAPLPERYWAVKAGVGTVGLNGQLHVHGVGAGVVIGILLTTLDLAPDRPAATECDRCGACIRACPGHALNGDGTLDARRCLSYLTIEHAGELPPGTDLHGRVYGCDICRRVCHLQPPEPPEPLDELRPDPRLLRLDLDAFVRLGSSDWRRLFGDSAVRRTSASRLRRNAANSFAQSIKNQQ